MNSAIPMISAFACSALITYASGSFFWGFWLPMCVVGLWLIHAVNGQFGWLSLMFLTTGVPYVLLSAFGAGLGIVLSNFQKRVSGQMRSIAHPIFLPSYAKNMT